MQVNPTSRFLISESARSLFLNKVAFTASGEHISCFGGGGYYLTQYRSRSVNQRVNQTRNLILGKTEAWNDL